MDISVVIISKNEEKNIKDCILSLAWCSEVIVIDDYSSDKTADIAKKLGAKIFKRQLDNDFAAQRNFGLAKTAGEWVLFVDADERLTEALASEILSFKYEVLNKYNGFYIKRLDRIWGKEIKHGDVWFLRLAKKGSGNWIGKVHERWIVEGEAGKLKNPIIHYPHQTLKEFIADIDFYTSLRAKELQEREENASLLKIFFYPKAKFFQNYCWHLGLLDGTVGFVHAILMSFHSFLSWSKLWLLQNKLSTRQ